MVFRLTTALCALVLSTHAYTPSLPPIPDEKIATMNRRADGDISVPLSELHLLNTEYTAFHSWIEAWLTTANSTPAALAQVDMYFQAYDGWMAAWMKSVMPSGAPASPGVTISAASIPTQAPFANATARISSKSSNETFIAQSSNNLAVYYGQTAATGNTSLSVFCEKDSNVDIVVLAFFTDFFGSGSYPTLNFGPLCNNASVAATAKNATGLLNCPDIAANITQCQANGKKVLLSLGGSLGTTNFTSDQQATDFATRLWNLFGAGTGEPGLRPFGNVTVDGFDVDNEDHSTDHYSVFVSALRTQLNSDKSRQYYISAAPQCPRPDESIPLEAMQSMDFIFMQFYNNAAANCDVGQPGFIDSLKSWAGDLSGNVTGKGPKLYIGAPACPKCAGKGYLEPADMQKTIKSALQANVSSLGGVMLWDGPEGYQNKGPDGKNYMDVVVSAFSS